MDFRIGIDCQTTADGSPTLYSHTFSQTYHSIHGAEAESLHVFIQNGLEKWHSNHPDAQELVVLELGLGSGLNAVLTANWASKKDKKITYISIEKYPPETVALESFISISKEKELLRQIHNSDWNFPILLTKNIEFHKIKSDWFDFKMNIKADVIFYDAFSPNSQPELWTEDAFKYAYSLANNNAVLTTYCAKGTVKRALRATGWQVSSPRGPKGKREITVAYKIHI